MLSGRFYLELLCVTIEARCVVVVFHFIYGMIQPINTKAVNDSVINVAE